MKNLYELLEQKTVQAPNDWALISRRKAYRFAELKDLVDQISNRLLATGVKQGDTLLIASKPALDWAVTLAASKIGAVSCSTRLLTEELSGLNPWWVTDGSLRESTELAFRQVIADESWLNPSEALANQTTVCHAFEPNDRFRLMLTSGSSGKPKVAVFSWGAISAKTKGLTGHWATGKREYNLMGLGSVGGYATALASLNQGLPFLAFEISEPDLLTFLGDNQVQTLVGSPHQISQFVELITRSKLVLPLLSKVRLAGSNPTAQLRDALIDRLNVEVTSVYGSTETGAIFTKTLTKSSDPDALGEFVSGAEARIVDASGSPLPEGTFGNLATRSKSMFDGFLNQDGSVESVLKDGWFLTDDLASASEGAFRFIGRDSDVLNIGGIKISAKDLDLAALEFPGVEDALCFETSGPLGKPYLAMAVVAPENLNVETLSAFLRKKFDSQAPQLIGRVSRIPRNDMGKPMRHELSKLFAKNLAG